MIRTGAPDAYARITCREAHVSPARRDALFRLAAVLRKLEFEREAKFLEDADLLAQLRRGRFPTTMLRGRDDQPVFCPRRRAQRQEQRDAAEDKTPIYDWCHDSARSQLFNQLVAGQCE